MSLLFYIVLLIYYLNAFEVQFFCMQTDVVFLYA